MSKYIATIGFFDGVHRGHQFLIQQMLHWGDVLQLDSLLITFDHHPRQVLSRDYIPRLLSTLPEKKEFLKATGVQVVKVLPFTEELSRLSAFEFMRNILVEEMGVKALVMGYDHHFGHGGGTRSEYVTWGKDNGLEVIIADPLPDERISSSLIRKTVMQGDLCEATRLLGHPYYIEGKVVPGHQIGRELGFPTANIEVNAEKLLPGRGVYAVRVLLPDGILLKGVLNIGERPTLHNGEDVSVEVHIFDFAGDLYAQSLRLEVVSKLRDEQSFSNTAQLKEQIASDCLLAEQILSRR